MHHQRQKSPLRNLGIMNKGSSLKIVRSMVTSLLSLSKDTAIPTASAYNPVVKLHSIHKINGRDSNNGNENLRIIHFIRHAEGYHNVNNDYKNVAHIDAQLTPKGIQQCKDLSRELKERSMTLMKDFTNDEKIDFFDVECIISSPMRRALQTAQHSFEHILQLDQPRIQEEKKVENNRIPFVACEAWRETVNYLCDQRLPLSDLRESFKNVDFDHIQHEHDPIWEKYESLHGAHDKHVTHRESGDDIGLRERATLAWDFIGQRNERNIAVVSHSAFFMHVFTRPELGVVAYADDEVECLMAYKPFENCEIRSIAFEML